MRISILGVDYRSAIFAGCLTFRGHRVIGFDSRQSRADWLNPSCGEALESGLAALLEQGWRHGLLSGTTDLAAAIRSTEITFLDGTREAEQGFCPMESLSHQVAEAIRDKREPHALLIRSSRSKEQVLAVILPILETVSGKRYGRDLQVEVRADYLDQHEAFPFWQAHAIGAGRIGVHLN